MAVHRRGLTVGLIALVVCSLLVAWHPVTACEDDWIDIDGPIGGGKVSGTLEITTKVKADVEWTKVEFFIDGKSVGPDADGPPFSIMWDTKQYTDGEHNLQAKGTLADGNVKESKIVAVTVDNG